MRGDSNRHGMRGGTRKKEEGLAESGRVLTSRATLLDSARRKPSEIPSRTRSVSAFLPG